MKKFNPDMSYTGIIYITKAEEREAANPIDLRRKLLIRSVEAAGIPPELHNRIFISAIRIKLDDDKEAYTRMRWHYIPDPGVYNLEEGVTP